MSLVCDVAVAGGGAIGMASAWRLAQAGLKVAVFERDRLGAEASSAAAGMLGAQLEVHEPGPFYQLCVASRERYPAFAAELLAETGIDIQYVRSGILKVAPSIDQAAALQAQAAWQRAAAAQGETPSIQRQQRRPNTVNPHGPAEAAAQAAQV
ncbi:MAG: FAD-binding oxidoreductase [Alicyclobacillus sp.]|nr:FAD-binding oxidoreductase [Alicyclobacillus sp.]